ncbi:MAG: hypothetical protein DRI56_05580 [Chloroflexota bacterium]|nr:MAG: hypothetical protein DRI56_05580 [Chloroflexota bacterium]
MKYSRLFLWVEGPDDKRFMEGVVVPHFEEKYDFVKIIEYAQEKIEWQENFLRSIVGMKGDYIFFHDNDTACFVTDKEKVLNRHAQLDNEKVLVVVKEIESWYLAGIPQEFADELGVSPPAQTDTVTKEQFDELIPKAFNSRIDFMQEVLKRFDVSSAQKRNTSFEYFVNKHSMLAGAL